MGSKTITRVDLVNALNEEVGLSKNDCAQLLNSVLHEITNSLIRDEPVKIKSFATFKTRIKNERTGRNPKTGEEVPIPPRRVVIFRPSLKIRNQGKAG